MCIGAQQCGVGDLNGDGKADAVAFIHGSTGDSSSDDVWAALSTGTGFSAPFPFTSGVCGSTSQVCAVADANADGNADLITIDPVLGETTATLSPSMPAPTLTSVTVSGTAATVTFADQSLTEDGFTINRWNPATGVFESRGQVTSTSRTGTGGSYTFTDTVTAGQRYCYEVDRHQHRR